MEQYLKITIPCHADLRDLLIAELSLNNFDSFQELDNTLEAYIQEENYNQSALENILKKYQISMDFEVEKQEKINWNKAWEQNYDPVYIDDKVQVRATFHVPKAGFEYDIVINPKMSFGTGHHATTHLMIRHQLKLNHRTKRVLDVGTGTGVLAIMAYKLGATQIVATDIDDWCIENSEENFKLNSLQHYTLLQGTLNTLALTGPFDLIFANINKNVLIQELPGYSKLLHPQGTLLLSGFYEKDIEDLQSAAQKCHLKVAGQDEMQQWALLRLAPDKE